MCALLQVSGACIITRGPVTSVSQFAGESYQITLFLVSLHLKLNQIQLVANNFHRVRRRCSRCSIWTLNIRSLLSDFLFTTHVDYMNGISPTLAVWQVFFFFSLFSYSQILGKGKSWFFVPPSFCILTTRSIGSQLLTCTYLQQQRQ